MKRLILVALLVLFVTSVAGATTKPKTITDMKRMFAEPSTSHQAGGR